MCGVGVAVVVVHELNLPVAPFASSVVVGGNAVAQVVQVRAFGVYDFAEQSLLRHVQHAQLELVVAAVLEHYAVTLCLFGSVDESPAVCHGCGCRNLCSYMFALLHCIYCNIGMACPVGTYIHKVNVGLTAQGFPSVVVAVSRG